LILKLKKLDMKTISNFKIAMLALMAAVVLFFSGCKPKDLTSSLQKVAPSPVKTVSLSFSDSVVVNNLGSGVRISADFPVSGNILVVNSIREWISENLGGTYSGDMANGQSMLQYYTKGINKDLQKDIAEFEYNSGAWYYIARFDKAYETDQYVTYQYYLETYMGGAHGSHCAEGQTFRKLDGRRMDWNVFRNDRMDALRAKIKSALQEQYFATIDQENPDDVLFEEAKNYFPLPESLPVFLEDGVEFTYQPYEIAPYAAGEPTCVISYESLSDYLSSTGKSLLGIEALADKQ